MYLFTRDSWWPAGLTRLTKSSTSDKTATESFHHCKLSHWPFKATCSGVQRPVWTCCSHWCNIPTCRCHDPNPPPSDNPSPLRYFPSLPELRAPARYEADLQILAKETDSCRKLSYGHPTLSPGIFTVYCQHGVCSGYEVMAQCESPKLPFQILFTRFPQAPHVIVYDNGCKLHVYCLNQEPGYFQNTLFLVDRFHWRGHTGCSSGYNLDLYGEPLLKTLNSQINEQANADLQKIRGQLAYMTPANFHFHLSLFISVKIVT